ncbi:hypothetical protein L596_013504 [Steinernema carpocapsae]|uniref:Uncharacterized protein n=1 Tax=Steinernema carpocapsae TaxID=34508 RepID=A0A4U5P0C9_STECR|nr:hypothetical protein L596_013504 [Steinernema carpocapsae]
MDRIACIHEQFTLRNVYVRCGASSFTLYCSLYLNVVWYGNIVFVDMGKLRTLKRGNFNIVRSPFHAT